MGGSWCLLISRIASLSQKIELANSELDPTNPEYAHVLSCNLHKFVALQAPTWKMEWSFCRPFMVRSVKQFTKDCCPRALYESTQSLFLKCAWDWESLILLQWTRTQNWDQTKYRAKTTESWPWNWPWSHLFFWRTQTRFFHWTLRKSFKS